MNLTSPIPPLIKEDELAHIQEVPPSGDFYKRQLASPQNNRDAIDDLHIRLQTLQADIDAKQVIIDTLKADIDIVSSEKYNLEEYLKLEFDSKLDSKIKQLEKQSGLLLTAQNDLIYAQQKIKKLEQEIEYLELEIASLQSVKPPSPDEALKAELLEANEKIDRLQNTIRSAKIRAIECSEPVEGDIFTIKSQLNR